MHHQKLHGHNNPGRTEKLCSKRLRVISFIHNKFHLLVSSGTVYSLLYSMERNGLIEGKWNERKRVYKLTEKGEKTIKAILNAKHKIQCFITQLLRSTK